MQELMGRFCRSTNVTRFRLNSENLRSLFSFITLSVTRRYSTNDARVKSNPAVFRRFALTNPDANDEASGEQDLLGPSHAHEDGAAGEYGAGEKDHCLPASEVVERSCEERENDSSADGDAHDQFLPHVGEREHLLQGQHGARDHSGVIAEEEPADGSQNCEAAERRGELCAFDSVSVGVGVGIDGAIRVVARLVPGLDQQMLVGFRRIGHPSRAQIRAWVGEREE